MLLIVSDNSKIKIRARRTGMLAINVLSLFNCLQLITLKDNQRLCDFPGGNVTLQIGRVHDSKLDRSTTSNVVDSMLVTSAVEYQAKRTHVLFQAVGSSPR